VVGVIDERCGEAGGVRFHVPAHRHDIGCGDVLAACGDGRRPRPS
jgi:hypothetical protein